MGHEKGAVPRGSGPFGYALLENDGRVQRVAVSMPRASLAAPTACCVRNETG